MRTVSRLNGKGLLIAGVVGLLLLAGQAAMADNTTATGTGTMSATILTAISISQLTGLNFGIITPSATAGTVQINDNGIAVTTTGGVTVAAGSFTRGEFSVQGTPGSNYSITPQVGDVTLTSGLNSMTVANNTIDTVDVSGTAKPTGTLTDGSDTFYVAAKLSVGANQAPGSYSGLYTITVAYD